MYPLTARLQDSNGGETSKVRASAEEEVLIRIGLKGFGPISHFHFLKGIIDIYFFSESFAAEAAGDYLVDLVQLSFYVALSTLAEKLSMS